MVLSVSCKERDLDTSGAAYKYKTHRYIKALNEVFPSKQGLMGCLGEYFIERFFSCSGVSLTGFFKVTNSRRIAVTDSKKFDRGRNDRPFKQGFMHSDSLATTAFHPTDDKRWGTGWGLPIKAACNTLYRHQKKVTMLFFGLRTTENLAPQHSSA
jgi:hypothetical protein